MFSPLNLPSIPHIYPVSLSWTIMILIKRLLIFMKSKKKKKMCCGCMGVCIGLSNYVLYYIMPYCIILYCLHFVGTCVWGRKKKKKSTCESQDNVQNGLNYLLNERSSDPRAKQVSAFCAVTTGILSLSVVVVLVAGVTAVSTLKTKLLWSLVVQCDIFQYVIHPISCFFDIFSKFRMTPLFYSWT